jgi:hypothetical protein
LWSAFSRQGLMNYLPGLASNLNPPDLCLPSSWDYRCFYLFCSRNRKWLLGRTGRGQETAEKSEQIEMKDPTPDGVCPHKGVLPSPTPAMEIGVSPPNWAERTLIQDLRGEMRVQPTLTALLSCQSRSLCLPVLQATDKCRWPNLGHKISRLPKQLVEKRTWFQEGWEESRSHMH